MYILGVEVPLIELGLFLLVLSALAFLVFLIQLKQLHLSQKRISQVSTKLGKSLDEQSDRYLFGMQAGALDLTVAFGEDLTAVDVGAIVEHVRTIKRKIRSLNGEAEEMETTASASDEKGDESDDAEARARTLRETSKRLRLNSKKMLIDISKQMKAKREGLLNSGNLEGAEALGRKLVGIDEVTSQFEEDEQYESLLDKASDIRRDARAILNLSYTLTGARAAAEKERAVKLLRQSEDFKSRAGELRNCIIPQRMVSASRKKSEGVNLIAQGENLMARGRTPDEASRGIDMIWQGRQLTKEAEECIGELEEDMLKFLPKAAREGEKWVRAEEDKLAKVEQSLLEKQNALNRLLREREDWRGKLEALDAKTGEGLAELAEKEKMLAKQLEEETAFADAAGKRSAKLEEAVHGLSKEIGLPFTNLPAILKKLPMFTKLPADYDHDILGLEERVERKQAEMREAVAVERSFALTAAEPVAGKALELAGLLAGLEAQLNEVDARIKQEKSGGTVAPVRGGLPA